MKTSSSRFSCVPLTRVALPVRTRAHTPTRHRSADFRHCSAEHNAPLCEDDGQPHKRPTPRSQGARPHVLHVDMDTGNATVLASLLVPEAQVTHVNTLAGARHALQGGVFSLVVLDPALPDGDARSLLPLLSGTPLLVWASSQPDWRGATPTFLAKPWTTARELWTAVATLLGIPSGITAGD